jgi:hypothetical protein
MRRDMVPARLRAAMMKEEVDFREPYFEVVMDVRFYLTKRMRGDGCPSFLRLPRAVI